MCGFFSETSHTCIIDVRTGMAAHGRQQRRGFNYLGLAWLEGSFAVIFKIRHIQDLIPRDIEKQVEIFYV